MGRFGIGARVRDDDGDTGVIVGKRKGFRSVKYEGNAGDRSWLNGETALVAKSSLTLNEASSQWVPKVGDRVRGKNSAEPCDGQIGKVAVAGREGANLDVAFDDWRGGHDGDANDDSDNHWYLNNEDVEPLPVAEQPAGLGAKLTIEAGRFYRTRNGRKVGPMVPTKVKWTDRSGLASAFDKEDGEQYSADGFWLAGGRHSKYDLVAEWVDESAVAPEATTDEVAAPESKFGFTIGDQVKPVSGDASYVNEHYSAHFDGRYGKSDGTYFVREFTGAEIGISAKNEGGAACFFLPSRFEPAAPPAKFKVGDRIKHKTLGYVGKVNKIVDEKYVGTTWDAPVGWSATDPIDVLEPAPAPALSATPTNFIVARLTPQGQPRPSARPRVHTTLASAETEAQRLADRLGDEFAVYQRVSSKTVDAGPVPTRWGMPFDAALAKGWVRYGKGEHPKANTAGLAFEWKKTKQGFGFWSDQCSALTPLGRAILRKWIAEAEANDKVAA